MRRLCLFTAGFLGAVLFLIYLKQPMILLPAAGLFLMGTFFFIRKKKEKKKILGLMLLGAIMGFLLFSLHVKFFLKPLKALDGKTLPSEISLTETPEISKRGQSARGFLQFQGKYYRVTAFFSSGDHLIPGDRIRGRFSFKLGEKPFSLLAYSDSGVERIPAGRTPWWAFPGRIRSYSERVLDLSVDAAAAPFAKALFLGDTEDLPFSVQWDLSAAGIRHLVAVSGLHVSVLCLALGLLTGRNRFLSAFLGIPLMLLFGAAAGFSPSVQRAVIMMSLLILGRLIGRKYDGLTELSAAVLLMLIIHPMTAAEISFQLSCASVLGIFLCYQNIKLEILIFFRKYRDFRDKLKEWFCGSVALSLSSLIFVAPLLAIHFGRISLIAPLTNLLTVFLVTPIFWGLLLTVLVSWFSMGAAALLGKGISYLIFYVLGVSRLLADLPFAEVYTHNGLILLWIFFAYLMGFYLLRGPVRETIYFFRFTAAGLILALALSWALPRIPRLTMRVFDVGQGQCILLQTRGRNYLVDCGGSRETAVAQTVLKTLKGQGIRRLDGLILTHFDRDHVGAADEILSVINARRIFLPDAENLPPDKRIYPVSQEETLTLKNAVIRLIPSESSESDNERGLCVLLDSREYDILITGDRSMEGERLLLENHAIGKVDCLIAGHHGASGSTSQALLEAVRPETVIISAGRGNPYGHPDPGTLLRIKACGASILRTDLQGTITIRR